MANGSLRVDVYAMDPTLATEPMTISINLSEELSYMIMFPERTVNACHSISSLNFIPPLTLSSLHSKMAQICHKLSPM